MKIRFFLIMTVCALLSCTGLVMAQEADVYGLPDFYVKVEQDQDSIEYLNSASEIAYTVGEIPAGEILHVTDLVYDKQGDIYWALITYNGMSGWIRLSQTMILRENIPVAVEEGSTQDDMPNAPETSSTQDDLPTASEMYGAQEDGGDKEPRELIVFVSIQEELELLETPGSEIVTAVVTDTTPLYFYGEEVIPGKSDPEETLAGGNVREGSDYEELPIDENIQAASGSEGINQEESYYSWLQVFTEQGDVGWVRSDQVILASGSRFLEKKEMQREEERKKEEERKREEEMKKLEEEQSKLAEEQKEQQEQYEQQEQQEPYESQALPETAIRAYDPDYTGSFVDYEKGRIITISADAIINGVFDPDTWELISETAYYYVARPARLRPEQASEESSRFIAFNNEDASDVWILFYDPFVPDLLQEEYKTGEESAEEGIRTFSRAENQHAE